MNQASQGKSALSSGDSAAAISYYTEAISHNSEAVDYYVQRSTAYSRLSPPDHQNALADAERALVLADKRGKRELIASSQLRRAIALYGLERWADSKQCLQWAKKFNDKEKSLGIWEMKADGKLKGLEEGDGKALGTVKERPDVEIPVAEKKETKKVDEGRSNKSVEESSTKKSISTTTPSKQSTQTPADKIRSDWYQSPDTVTVTLLAKGIPKEQAHVKIEEESLEITFPLNSGSDYDFTLDPLYSKIDPAASSFKIMSTKAEFLLKKSTPGVKWASLEKTGPVSSSPDNAGDSGSGDGLAKDAAANLKPKDSAPAYPTSSKSGPKNWDKLAADLSAKPRKKGEGEGDDQDVERPVDDDEEGDAVDGFFKKLFKDADPDTRRAMMKSYQESNGTALSTNWAEVSKSTVETSPPEGMVAKKWGT